MTEKQILAKIGALAGMIAGIIGAYMGCRNYERVVRGEESWHTAAVWNPYDWLQWTENALGYICVVIALIGYKLKLMSENLVYFLHLIGLILLFSGGMGILIRMHYLLKRTKGGQDQTQG